MGQKNLHERSSGFFTAIPKWLLPVTCVSVLILACIVWFYWPVSLVRAAGAGGEIQSIYMMDVSSPVLQPKEKLITDDNEMSELLSIRLRRRAFSDNVVRDGWAYTIYLASSDSRTEPIFLTERFVQIGNSFYTLLDSPAFLDFRDRIYR